MKSQFVKVMHVSTVIVPNEAHLIEEAAQTLRDAQSEIPYETVSVRFEVVPAHEACLADVPQNIREYDDKWNEALRGPGA